MDTEQLYSQFQNATTEDAENIISQDTNNELQYNHKISVKVPEPGEMVVIDLKSINKIRTECDKAKNNHFPWAEVLLGVSSLFIGAFLSALMSQISYELKFLSVLFYTICPTAGIGCGVAYIFCRKNDMYTAKQLAEKIEDYISNDENGGTTK